MRILIDGQTFETLEVDRGIGVYTRNVLTCMLKQDYGHEWFITVSDRNSLKILDPWVREKLQIITDPIFQPVHNQNNTYTDRIENIIGRYDIDVFWVPNPLMVNVHFLTQPVSCVTFVTIYDLIPYIMPIKEWPKMIKDEYLRRLQIIKNTPNIRLLMISEATRHDWEKYMQDTESISIVTPLAADTKLFFQEKESAKSEKPFILFTGGFDYRKNVDGAIKAFSLARKKHSDDPLFLSYKLVITGKYNQEVKEKYDGLIEKNKLSDHVELTGFVSDKQLAELYHRADIFFFPSLYEGFGLPVLEAMLSGDYIVCADNSSLPEVCRGYAVLFDADNLQQMADALWLAYQNQRQESTDDIRERQNYALQFRWENTAQDTLAMMEAYFAEPEVNDKKPKLALLTPWPPQQTGIANYEYKLLPYLAEWFDITVFTPAIREAQFLPAEICVRHLDDFPAQYEDFDYKLYQIGNNADFHLEIFELLEKFGGFAEIHDFVLTPFFWGSYHNNLPKWEELLKSGYGTGKGKEFLEQTRKTGTHPDIYQCPMSETVAAVADRVFFHNHWSSKQLNQRNVQTIPLAAFPISAPSDEVIHQKYQELKKKIHYQDGDFIIGCFGWVNTNKRPEVSVQAVKGLVEAGFHVKLVFWGKSNISGFSNEIKKQHLEENVYISGYLDNDEYYTALQMTDVVVNLRYPSMGESSATLCEAFQMSKPVIVSDLNQYREFPNNVCWKLPVGEYEVKLLQAYLEKLLTEPDLRCALGSSAKKYAEHALDPVKIANMYFCCITKKTQIREAKPYAFVIPWYGDDIQGGAEKECNQLAHLFLEHGIPVEVLTTCVRRASDDRGINTLKAGVEYESDVLVRRFPVKTQNKERYIPANLKLYRGEIVSIEEELAYLEEDINSPDLYQYIRNNKDGYEAFIFLPYMYGLSYFGSQECPNNAVMIPCLHDESYAYMHLIKERMRQIKKMIFLSEPEHQLAERLYDLRNTEWIVPGAYVESGWEEQTDPERFRQKYSIHSPFILYAGRKDSGKKADMLMDYYCRYRRSHKDHELKLVFIGGGELEIPAEFSNDVIDLGFVSAEDKHDAFAAAFLLCNPSFFESFSIVIMESWLVGRPVLVSEQCAVTTNFCRESNGGLWFRDYSSFSACLSYLLNHPETANEMGKRGQKYVKEHFTKDVIFQKYMEFLK